MDDIKTIRLIINDPASEPDSKTQAKADLEGVRQKAELAIRNHQREVSFETKEYTVELTVEKYSSGLEDDENELFVPDYQRDFVWDEEKKSRLIESIMIGLPIPYIFIADIQEDEDPNLDGRTEIVDGSQRIRTLHAFLNEGLELSSLDLLHELNGFKFEDLPRARQRRFKRATVRIIELGSCTEGTRRDLFERINTGSDTLRDMEVRKGSQLGDTKIYNELILPCSNSTTFKEATPISSAKARRGEHLEFTLRFFAYLENYQNFNHSVRDFLNDYLKQGTTYDEEKIKELKDEFHRTMDFAHKNLPYGFAKSKSASSTPRVRFEALAVGIALALRENPNLEPQNINEWLFSEEFKKHTTSDAANSRPRVIQRIEFVKEKLLDD